MDNPLNTYNPDRATIKAFFRENPQAAIDYLRAPASRGGGASKAVVGEIACELLMEQSDSNDEKKPASDDHQQDAPRAFIPDPRYA